ncbi:ATP-binding protein [Phytoactinopolyspora halotolerans]|uniref:histidine kinase n=1 Tax=Phytoactinopolyspora halotolerans TaxID=1981512 RepID=A0A6L9SD90_9ACTN|nr:histidine kinase [Phytoactinopolyspora halotolerans]NEE03345.1 hypothetical protein [Phytoactinopolyspora halotolerans]
MEVHDADAATPARDPATARSDQERKRGVRWVIDAIAYGPSGATSPRGVAGGMTALVGFGVLLLLLGVTDLWQVPDALGIPDGPEWWHALTFAGVTAAVAIERAHPAAALVVGSVVAAADIGIGGSLSVLIMLWEILYSYGMNGSVKGRRIVTTVVVVMVGAGAVAGTVADGDISVGVLVGLQLGAVFGMPLWWASNVRQKSELAELAAQRADLEARRADLEAQRAADIERIAELRRSEAVQAERARIARDLHDAIASRLSTVAIHSAGALAAPGRDQQPVLQTVRAEALEALREMRTMITVLRSGPEDGAGDHASGVALETVAPGGVERLNDLVEASRWIGLRTRLVLPPDWEETRVSAPVAVAQAAYRIIQEALANASKHAPGGEATVRLQNDDDELLIVVENTLPEAPASHADDDPALSAGVGLVTMRERAESLGGRFSAGPWRGGGIGDAAYAAERGADRPGGAASQVPAMWRVEAVLPLCGGGERTDGAT